MRIITNTTIEVEQTLTKSMRDCWTYWLDQPQYDMNDELLDPQQLWNELVGYQTMHINRIVEKRAN